MCVVETGRQKAHIDRSKYIIEIVERTTESEKVNEYDGEREKRRTTTCERES